MKSLLEKLSKVKLGPLGKRDLGPVLDRSISPKKKKKDAGAAVGRQADLLLHAYV
jgi:hypothetical protein